MAPVEIRDLSKHFGAVAAVNHLSFDIEPGRVTGFLGPNGAGKSTTLRALLGLVQPSSGSATFGGLRYDELDEPSARVGAVLEDASFHPGRSARNHLRVLAITGNHPPHRVEEVLSAVGLSDAADRRVKGYSMGMRQRLGIARCLLADPELLILDEPTNGLDPAGIIEFREFVRSLVDDGRTVFLSSHLLDEVEKICDMAAIVDRGKILMQGTVAEMAAGGQPTITLGLNDAITAERLLLDHPAVVESGEVAGGLRLVLSDGSDAAIADINRRLVEGGIAVHRIEPARVTLEERFLEVTSRFGAST